MAYTTAHEIGYLNTTVFCTLRPSVHGIGVFAIRDIPQGIQLTDHTLHDREDIYTYRMSPEQFLELDEEVRNLILDRTVFEADEEIIFTSPNADALLTSFMNHSDTPNSDGQYATRFIAKGEEITEDYRTLADDMHSVSKEHMSFLTDANTI